MPVDATYERVAATVAWWRRGLAWLAVAIALVSLVAMVAVGIAFASTAAPWVPPETPPATYDMPGPDGGVIR